MNTYVSVEVLLLLLFIYTASGFFTRWQWYCHEIHNTAQTINDTLCTMNTVKIQLITKNKYTVH
jgi:hypothetical protein